MQTSKRKRYQKDSAPADDIITLINLVRQNPALYNYKLQPNQRRRSDVLNGWAQIAVQIGNKYTVEECRRKWKNLRDTYHQYRLRKPKLGDGLSKWRYARELEFLSNVYQPKLKSQRSVDYTGTNNNNSVNEVVNNNESNLLEATEDDDANGQVVDNQHVNRIVHHHHHHQQPHHHHTNIMVNDDTETFILTAYEESVTDDGTMTHMELSHTHDDDEVQEIVKHEPASSMDDDGATGAEVDYEEVCLYEEATGANAPTVDCETIVATATSNTVGGNQGTIGHSVTQDGNFHYIATNDFCLSGSTATGLMVAANSGANHNGNNNNNSMKIKGVTVLGSTNVSGAVTPVTITGTTSLLQLQQQQPHHHHHHHQQQQQQQQQQHHQQQQQQHDNRLPSLLPSVVTTTTTADGTLSATSSLTAAPATPPSSTANMFNIARDELDLFFDFLKKKMQNFSRDDLTSIQVEFLNCVLRRESEQRHINNQNGNNSLNHHHVL